MSKKHVTGKRSRSPEGDDVGISGLVYGCTVGNIVAHCKLPGQRTTVFIRQLRERLEIFARLHSRMQGSDKEQLAQGLASGRASKSIICMLEELSRVKIDSRLGGRGTVIGATAAVLLSVEMSSVSTVDAEWVVKNGILGLTIERAIHTLLHSVQTGMSDMAERSKGVEIRALQRAAAGVKRATVFVSEIGLSGRHALMVQVMSAARAAFPAAVVCSNTQSHLLKSVAAEVELLTPRSTVPLEAVGMFIPLSAIPHIPEGACDECMSSTDSSVPSSTCSEVDQ